MSTIVCQGFQSCLEPRLIEPLIFKHILAPPKPNPSMIPTQEYENKTKNTNEKGNLGAWSFIQSLATPQTNQEKIYVHPITKKSSSILSKQSLDMCTESLGNETGTHESSSLSLSREREISVRPSKLTRKLLRNRSFPPPLSSSYSVQVKPHRENGRLVIKAIKKASQNNHFQVERKNGRLKMTLLKENLYTDNDHEEGVTGDHKMVESMEENSGKFGGQIEKMKNMCKEQENHEQNGIVNWGPFLMATS